MVDGYKRLLRFEYLCLLSIWPSKTLLGSQSSRNHDMILSSILKTKDKKMEGIITENIE